MTDNTCICCGAVIPEGRQICWICERGDNMMIDYDSTFDKIQELYKNSSGEVHKAYSKCLDVISEMPEVDAEPVKRGVIAHDKLTHYYFCQDCLFQIEESDIQYYNFCPHCGTKFDKD